MTMNLTRDELTKECEQLRRQVSAYRDALDNLRESNDRYQAILDTMEEGYLEVDLAGRFTFVNDSEARMLGYSCDELLGLSYLQYTSQQTSKFLYQEFRRVHDTGKPSMLIDYEVIRKDGGIRIHELSISLIRDGSGNPVGFRGVSRDVTDRKQAEEALRDREKKYRQLFMNAPAAIYEVDYQKHCFISFNDIIPVLTGYTREELMQMDPWDLFTEESRRTYLDRIGLMKESVDVSASQEYTIRKKDGSIMWVNTSIDYIMEDGLPVRARIVAHDITERKRIALERESLISELQKALADVKTLRGLFPICANCKKIRDDKGYWNQIENYISEHSEALFSHSICPECMQKLYPDFMEKKK